MHGKEGQRETEAEPGEMHLQGKECEGPRCRQRPGGRKEARPPPSPPSPEPAAGGAAPMTPGACSGGRGRPSSLQGCEETHFGCFKALRWGSFLTAAPGN